MSRPDTSAQAVARRLVVAFVIIVILFSIGMLTVRASRLEREPTTVTTVESVIGWTLAGAPSGLLGRLVGSRSGLATWYCCTRGYSPSAYVAAAGPALRIGHWRGRYVWVMAGTRRIRVKLVDYCVCHASVVIDLHPAAFRALVPLSRGVVKVRVTW